MIIKSLDWPYQMSRCCNTDILSSHSPPSAASLCSLTRVFFFFLLGVCNPGQHSVRLTALVVLCKTQPRGRDVTPIEGEAQGTLCVCVCTHSDVYPWCLFNPVCSSAGGRLSRSTMTHSSTHVYARSVKRTQMWRREHVEDKIQHCLFTCL